MIGRIQLKIKIENITFCHSLTLGPLCDDGRVAFTIEPESPPSAGPGVYIVFENEKIAYIGSYQSGVTRRWLYLQKKDVYHFKKPLVAESLSRGAILRVYVQDERAIKEQLGCGDNVWVNSAGIETRLISLFRPPWNNLGKNPR